jgi:actin-related protein
MTHLTGLLKNKIILQKNYHLQEVSMDQWPFWMLEENIKIVNEMSDEEEKNNKRNDAYNNFKLPDTSSILNNVSSFTKGFKV